MMILSILVMLLVGKAVLDNASKELKANVDATVVG